MVVIAARIRAEMLRKLRKNVWLVGDIVFFFFQAEDGIRDVAVTGVQTCALPICLGRRHERRRRPHVHVDRGGRSPGGAARAVRGRAFGHPRRGRSRAARTPARSEERRVGKEGRYRWSPYTE